MRLYLIKRNKCKIDLPVTGIDFLAIFLTHSFGFVLEGQPRSNFSQDLLESRISNFKGVSILSFGISFVNSSTHLDEKNLGLPLLYFHASSPLSTLSGLKLILEIPQLGPQAWQTRHQTIINQLFFHWSIRSKENNVAACKPVFIIHMLCYSRDRLLLSKSGHLAIVCLVAVGQALAIMQNQFHWFDLHTFVVLTLQELVF